MFTILLLLLNLLISTMSMIRSLFFFFLNNNVFYYGILWEGKMEGLKTLSCVPCGPSWIGFSWLELRKMSNSWANTSKREKLTFIIVLVWAYLLANIEPVHQNQHSYMCGDGVLCPASKAPSPIVRVFNSLAEYMQKTTFMSPRGWDLWITETENRLVWKTPIMATTFDKCLWLRLKD